MQRVKGVLQILGGLGLWAFGITIGVAWIAFCFGTIVIGVLLLLLAPRILLMPFSIGIVPGDAMLALGLVNFLEGGAKGDPEAAQRDMSNGLGRTPTWATDPGKLDQFLKGVLLGAVRAGVPQTFAVEKFEDKEILRVFVQYSGALEHHRCSYAKQQEEVVALLINQWNKLGGTEKEPYGQLEDVATNAAGRAYQAALENPDEVNQMGVESAKKGDFGSAALRFRHAAEMGHAGAACNLGFMISEGKGFPQDHAEACKWYKLSAGRGLAEGQYHLALSYLHGQGVEKDLAKAYHYFKVSAEQGLECSSEHVEEFEEAVEENWRLFEHFSDDPEDLHERRRAVILYLRSLGTIDGLERAVAAGDRDSALNISLMHLTGDRVPKDAQRAYEWMQKAADIGNIKASLVLKMVRPEAQASVAELQPTFDLCDRAEEGDQASRYEIGRRFLRGVDVEPNPTAAALWFLLSHNYPPSRAALHTVPREQWPEDFHDQSLAELG